MLIAVFRQLYHGKAQMPALQANRNDAAYVGTQ